VRIEGASDTALARTAITPGTTAVVKDGNDAHSCAADSAAGALEAATGKDWNGPWFDGLGYSVETIKGATHAFGSGRYWAFYVNGYAAQTGICGATLQQGDSLVFAAVGETDANALLDLSGVPATVAPGAAFTVSVKRLTTTYGPPPDFLPSNGEEPAGGATVGGGGASATTDADGKATLTLTQRGPATLRASSAGDVRSASESVCVTDGADGYCGTVAPGQTTSPTPPPAAAAVQSAAVDREVPFGSVASIPEQQHYRRGKAPRQLSGSVADEPSGIQEIRLRLTRRLGKRCERYDAARERWVKASRCGADNSPFFAIGDRTPWSYLLPQALTKGRYVLDVQVADRAGNVTRGNARGGVGAQRNRVVFFVD
jgi:hypothetical protein